MSLFKSDKDTHGKKSYHISHYKKKCHLFCHLFDFKKDDIENPVISMLCGFCHIFCHLFDFEKVTTRLYMSDHFLIKNPLQK